MRPALALLCSLALLGCPKGADAFQARFIAACEGSSNLERPVCECMAAKAEKELGSDERAFVLAALSGDEATTTELRGKLGLEGAMKAGMFMTNVGSCAARPAGE